MFRAAALDNIECNSRCSFSGRRVDHGAKKKLGVDTRNGCWGEAEAHNCTSRSRHGSKEAVRQRTASMFGYQPVVHVHCSCFRYLSV